MKHPIQAYLLASVLLALAATSAAQSSAQVIELIEYTNDSLGFKTDLPCDPKVAAADRPWLNRCAPMRDHEPHRDITAGTSASVGRKRSTPM